MSKRTSIRSKKLFDQGTILEKSGDIKAALKLYAKSSSSDPLNVQAWNRQMLLYRKIRTKHEEAKLIKNAIASYQSSATAEKKQWLVQNRDKAESSRELAQVLGLLEPTGLPKADHPTIEKWQTRLYLLEYRIKNENRRKAGARLHPAKSTGSKRPKKEPPQKRPATKEANPIGKKVKEAT